MWDLYSNISVEINTMRQAVKDLNKLLGEGGAWTANQSKFLCSNAVIRLVGWLVDLSAQLHNSTEYICTKFGWILAKKKAIFLFSNLQSKPSLFTLYLLL